MLSCWNGLESLFGFLFATGRCLDWLVPIQTFDIRPSLSGLRNANQQDYSRADSFWYQAQRALKGDFAKMGKFSMGNSCEKNLDYSSVTPPSLLFCFVLNSTMKFVNQPAIRLLKKEAVLYSGLPFMSDPLENCLPTSKVASTKNHLLLATSLSGSLVSSEQPLDFRCIHPSGIRPKSQIYFKWWMWTQLFVRVNGKFHY